jgi:hypothetical protein
MTGRRLTNSRSNLFGHRIPDLWAWIGPPSVDGRGSTTGYVDAAGAWPADQKVPAEGSAAAGLAKQHVDEAGFDQIGTVEITDYLAMPRRCAPLRGGLRPDPLMDDRGGGELDRFSVRLEVTEVVVFDGGLAPAGHGYNPASMLRYAKASRH